MKQETSPFAVLKTQEFYENTFDVYFRQLKGDWIHHVTLYTLPEGIDRQYPDGSNIPTKTIHEAWFIDPHLTETMTGIYFVKDLQGNVLQTVLTKDGIAYNLTFQEQIEPLVIFNGPERTPVRFEFGLSRILGELKIDSFQNLTVKDLNKDEMVTILKSILKPLSNVEPENMSVVGLKIVRSLENGMLKKLTIEIEKNPTDFVSYEFSNLIIEKVSAPPKSIVAVLTGFEYTPPANTIQDFSGVFPGTNISWETSNDVRVKNSTTFHSESWSWASTAIGTIGWSTRSNQVLCSNVVIDGEQFGGYVNYNSMSALQGYAASETYLTICSGGNANRTIKVNTYHEFKYSSTGIFRKYDGAVSIAP